MLKLILSNNTEIEVMDGSTLFDIQVEPSKYQSMWNHLTPENMMLVKLTTESGTMIDQGEYLVVDSEQSVKEKEVVYCHFYLREKTKEELLEEKVAILEEMLNVHDEAIGDLGVAIGDLSGE